MESHNDLYHEIAEQAPDGVIVAGIEGEIIFWNDRAEIIFGYSRHEVLGQSIDIIIPMELREAHWAGFNRAISEGRTRSSGQAMITKSLDKTGRKIYIDMTFAVLKSATGIVTGALALVRDVTERYTAEKALRAELRDLRKQLRSGA